MSTVTDRVLSRSLFERKKAELDYVNQTYGQLISNFKQYRLNAQLSLEDLIRVSYISKNAIVRAEQGTYTNPLPSLTQYWQRRLEISELIITDGYFDFQHEQRQRYPLYFGPVLTVDLNANLHPFRQLRRRHFSQADGGLLPVGVDEASRALCLPVDTLRYWEKRYRSQKTVPKAVINVLIEIGYHRSQVDEFCSSYVVWRDLNNGVVSHD